MLTTEQWTGIIRAALAAFGGAGILSGDQLTAVAGGLAVLVVTVWSVLSKKKAA